MEKCEHCGAKMYKYWHKLNEPLCLALFELYKYDRPVNIAEIGLTHNQICNFMKLKYWGFVERISHGVWNITQEGIGFCENKLLAPSKIQTYRDKVCMLHNELQYFKEICQKNWGRIDYYLLTRRPRYNEDEQNSLFE